MRIKPAPMTYKEYETLRINRYANNTLYNLKWKTCIFWIWFYIPYIAIKYFILGIITIVEWIIDLFRR